MRNGRRRSSGLRGSDGGGGGLADSPIMMSLEGSSSAPNPPRKHQQARIVTVTPAASGADGIRVNHTADAPSSMRPLSGPYRASDGSSPFSDGFAFIRSPNQQVTF